MKSFTVKNSLMQRDLTTKNGQSFIYEQVTHLNTINITKATDPIIDESINVPRRSMKGLPLF